MANPASRQVSEQALDALLTGYVAGTLSPLLHLLVAGHVALSSRSRALVRSLEAEGGNALERMAPMPLADREERLAKIVKHPQEEPLRDRSAPDQTVPLPLFRYFGAPLHELRWRTLLTGVREHRVGAEGGFRASLYWISPGCMLPAHTHDGSEYTLVLKGGFSDEQGHHRRGDIVIAGRDVEHHARAHEGEDCVCYIVTDGPLRLIEPVVG